MNNEPLMVTVQCITYNHESFIRECLDGFVMQKTNFRFEVVVHDDASTDNTSAIIREYELRYPEIIKPIYETENQYSKYDGSLERIMNMHTKGLFVAFCEGDDYWIDPLKLQKQVDFLKENNDLGLVYGNAFIRKGNDVFGNIASENYDFISLLKNNNIPTATIMLRRSMYEEYNKIICPDKKKWMMGDYPLVLYFSSKGMIGYIDSFFAVRRISIGTASNSTNLNYILSFEDSVADIQKFYIDNYYNGKDYSRLIESIMRTNSQNKLSLELNLGGKYEDIKKLFKSVKNRLGMRARIVLGFALCNSHIYEIYRKYKLRELSK